MQVKCAWLDEPSRNHVVDNRRTKTNRRAMVRDAYQVRDFDFALVYLPERDLFYVFPVKVFIGYGSEIHMVEAEKRQRKPGSAEYQRLGSDFTLGCAWGNPRVITCQSRGSL